MNTCGLCRYFSKNFPKKCLQHLEIEKFCIVMNFFCFGVSYLQIQQTKTRQTTEVLLSHITAVLQVSIQ